MAFNLKTVESKMALGEWFRKEREARGWTMKKASRETNIGTAYLEAMEKENWHQLPQGPSRRSLILNYIRTLGGDAKIEILAEGIAPKIQGSDAKGFHPIRRTPRSITPAHLKLIGLGLLFVALLIYLGFEARALVAPPALSVLEPIPGFVTNTPTLTVRGHTDTNASVTVNARAVLKNPDGEFETSVDLLRGTNVLTISAKRKHSKPNIIYRTILFEP